MWHRVSGSQDPWRVAGRIESGLRLFVRQVWDGSGILGVGRNLKAIEQLDDNENKNEDAR